MLTHRHTLAFLKAAGPRLDEISLLIRSHVGPNRAAQANLLHEDEMTKPARTFGKEHL